MLIDYKNVNIYQDEKLILKDVNLQVNEGDFIYLIGKVGSGKSSLLKTLYCELDVDPHDRETSMVLDNDIATIKRKLVPALRKQLGIIFQDFQLLHDRTVYRNLRFVLKATGWNDKQEIDNRINQVLEEVGMMEKRDKMPHELSGGEQQRIAIARAILNKPKIIIADEPTGNLDPGDGHNDCQHAPGSNVRLARRLLCRHITSLSSVSSPEQCSAAERARSRMLPMSSSGAGHRQHDTSGRR